MPVQRTRTLKIRARRALLCALGIGWLGTVAAGLWVVRAYDNAPGVSAQAPVRWPAATRLTPAPAGPTLVMLAHPKCPCTRASLDELAEVMARTRRAAKTYVLFVRPSGFADGWEHSDLWQKAAAIPGVTPVRDDEGLEAARFGTATSTRQLKQDEAVRHIPIIVLSAHAMIEDRNMALAAGGDDFDTKPVRFQSLLAKIELLLANRVERR